jgi:hypothetical protein
MPNILKGNNEFPKDINFSYVPIHFDTVISTAAIGAFIPPEFNYAQIVTVQNNGSSATLNMKQIYTTTNMNLTTAKLSITAYANKAVEFSTTITGGTKATFLLKLSVD